MLKPHEQKLQEIFFPHLTQEQRRVSSNGTRFVHYTSAANAVDILTKGRIWMRKTMTMNDFREIEHGYDCLRVALASEAGGKFRNLLQQIEPALDTTLFQRVDSWMPSIRFNTYITCISEHESHEDDYGRLSMWRAYGGNETGVALVLKQEPIVKVSHAMGAYSMPVAYKASHEVSQYLADITDMATREIDFLKALGPELISDVLFSMVRFAIVAIKHPGFHEEREWRVVYTPEMTDVRRIKIEPEIVRGTPQMVAKIPLVDVPDEGLVGLNIPDFLDRLIIGPTQFPAAIHERFHYLLTEVGVTDVNRKLVASDIPLRR